MVVIIAEMAFIAVEVVVKLCPRGKFLIVSFFIFKLNFKLILDGRPVNRGYSGGRFGHSSRGMPGNYGGHGQGVPNGNFFYFKNL